jgi:adenylosuccinate lyase
MIDRYEHDAIAGIWSRKQTLHRWFQILQAWGRAIDHPIVSGKLRGDRLVRLCDEVEAVTNHDVAAFIDVVCGHCGGVASQYAAWGLTSSDIVDTSNSMAIRDSMAVITSLVEALKDALRDIAREHARTICIGRTHGQEADLTTYGFKMATFYYDLVLSGPSPSPTFWFGMLSGPVGMHTLAPGNAEKMALAELSLLPHPITSQAVSRVAYSAVAKDLSLLSEVLAKWSVNLRLLLRGRLADLTLMKGVQEKGSSSMPHKTNPVALEKVTGLHRLVEGYARAISDGVQLWDERDMSHSCVERVAFPDLFHCIAQQLTTLLNALPKIKVHVLRMQTHAAACPDSHVAAHRMIDDGQPRAQAYEAARKAPEWTYTSQGVAMWMRAHGDRIERQIERVLTL